jgi:tRNA (guanine37-N1)-methyltransferase
LLISGLEAIDGQSRVSKLRSAMKFDIVTIFPEFFRGPFEHGIIRRAREAGLVEINIHDLRNWTHDRHRTVDDRPFGGGEGMVLKPEPIFECMEGLGVAPRSQRIAHDVNESVVLTSAGGQIFSQQLATDFAQLERVILLCGRYEGVDERVSEHIADREVSIGDYVLSGGELAAAVIVDTVTRLIPGALGNEASAWQESFSASERSFAGDGPDSTCASRGLLDYPHYTRPAEFKGIAVPEVLMGGDHAAIRRWRRQKALEKTVRNRPDLLRQAALTKEDQILLAQIERGRNSD